MASRLHSHMRLIAGLAAVMLLLTLALPAGPVGASPPLVTNCNDSDSGSLRAAIAAALDGDTIHFQAGLNCPSASPILLTSGTLTLATNLTIDGTGATIAVGGNGATTAFTLNSGVTAALNAMTILNPTSFGSGILMNGSGVLTVTNSTFPTDPAGGIHITGSGSGTLTVANCIFAGNAGSGVGIFISGSGSGVLTVTSSTFSAEGIGIRNGSDGGGGVGTLTVTNSTFATNYDGGIVTPSGVLTVTSSTFSGNGAGGGSAITNLASTTTITNVIVANSAGGPDLYGTFVGNNNLIDDASGTLTGTGNIRNTPALLGPLGNNGGPTQTIPLLPGSPAINAGAAVGAGPAGNTVPATDQRGLPRVGTPDIGAFEVQSAAPTISLSPATVPDGVVGTAYSQTISATGGTTPYAFTVTGGTLPTGLSLNPTSGLLSGTPSAAGMFTFTVQAQDATNATGAQTYTVTIVATASPLVSIAVAPNPVTMKVGQTQQFTATGTYADNSTADLTSQVTWAGDTPNVASVDTSGRATAKSAGTAHVMATLGGKSGQTTVTVSPPTLTGVQPAPAPNSRPSGASTSGTSTAVPAPAPAPRSAP